MTIANERSPEGTAPSGSRAFGVPRRALTGVLLAVLVSALLTHAFLIETFTVPSASMEPTLVPGDRIVVNKLEDDPTRGDVIVFSGAGVFYETAPREGVFGALDTAVGWFGFRPGEQDYVKRVIGVGGDRVSVGGDGVLRVNGRALAEPYLRSGTRASAQTFDVRVPQGRLFVLGDNRDASDDSRSHLGDPGGGNVPLDHVVGTLAGTYWSAR